MCSAKESKNESNKRIEETVWNIEISSVHETHIHASLNDSCLPFLIREGQVNVAFVHTEISIISQGGENKKGLQLKHHGYLAVGVWGLIQNLDEEHQWHESTLKLALILLTTHLPICR